MNKKYSKIALLALVAISLGSLIAFATGTLALASGGPPAVSVTSVTLAQSTPSSELADANVNFSATAPKGTTITGFSVTVAVTKKNSSGATSTDAPVTATSPGGTGAHSVVVPKAVFIQGFTAVSYNVTIQTNYTSVLNTTKTGNF